MTPMERTVIVAMLIWMHAWPTIGRGQDRRSFTYTAADRSVWIHYSPLKRRLKKEDMKEIAELNPRKVLFDHVVMDRDAKKYFAAFTSLEELVIVRSNFGDEELRALANCDIKFANLIDTDLTDDIVDVLAGFEALRIVYLERTAVTHEGYERLRKARPDMTVYLLTPAVPRYVEASREEP